LTNDNWHTGNAADEAGQYRGWMVGHFVNPANGAVRKTGALEVKWGIHPAGQKRPEWTDGEDRSTLVIMISGRFRVDLSVGAATLTRQGDYVTWGPGIEHSWQAEEDSVVITVRWPSAPLTSSPEKSLQ
jgi:quercetin dioxygenase-like cupin family protein